VNDPVIIVVTFGALAWIAHGVAVSLQRRRRP